MIVTERMDDRGKEKENWHSDRKEKEKLLLLPFPTFFIVAYTCNQAMFGNDNRDGFPFFLSVKSSFFLLHQRHGESHTGEEVR